MIWRVIQYTCFYLNHCKTLPAALRLIPKSFAKADLHLRIPLPLVLSLLLNHPWFLGRANRYNMGKGSVKGIARGQRPLIRPTRLLQPINHYPFLDSRTVRICNVTYWWKHSAWRLKPHSVAQWNYGTSTPYYTKRSHTSSWNDQSDLTELM